MNFLSWCRHKNSLSLSLSLSLSPTHKHTPELLINIPCISPPVSNNKTLPVTHIMLVVVLYTCSARRTETRHLLHSAAEQQQHLTSWRLEKLTDMNQMPSETLWLFHFVWRVRFARSFDIDHTQLVIDLRGPNPQWTEHMYCVLSECPLLAFKGKLLRELTVLPLCAQKTRLDFTTF